MFLMFLATIVQILLLSLTQSAASVGLPVNVTGILVSQSVQFTNSSIFFDLSQYNFVRGKYNTYEYTIKARPGKQVFIYFYTSLTDNAVVEVYDGLNDGAALLNLSQIDSAIANVYKPAFVKSTNGVLLIRINALNKIINLGMQDFQALATDYQNAASCEYLVWACNLPETPIDYTMFGNSAASAPCLSILHATDTTNDIRKIINIDRIPGNFTMKIYKGLDWSPAAEIDTDDIDPIYVFDKHVIVEHTRELTFNTIWNIQSNLLNLNIGLNSSVMMMSPDYKPYDIKPLIGTQIHQTFNILPLGKIGLDISFQSPILNGVVTISAIMGNAEKLLTTLFNVTKLPNIYSIDLAFDRIIVQYTSSNVTNAENTFGSGFYAIAKARDIDVTSGSNVPLMLSLGLIIGKFLF